MTKRVLVTGATGFIGRHALGPLVQRGYEVHGAGLGEPPPDTPGVTWHEQNLLEAAGTAKLIGAIAPTHLLHMAWVTTPGTYWTSPENLDWAGASVRLVKAFTEAGGKRAVVAGTCAEYDWSHEHMMETLTPLKPQTLYGTCKHATREMLSAYAEQTELSLGWGRVFFLYGPHEHPDRLVASVARALLQGQRAETTHGTQLRDFLHVADVAGGLVALLDSAVEGPVNIASGEPVTLREVVDILGKVTGRPDLLAIGARPAPPGEPAEITARTRRLHEDVGFTPSFTLEAGLTDAVNWWRQQLGL